jgi:hypothetical protein
MKQLLAVLLMSITVFAQDQKEAPKPARTEAEQRGYNEAMMEVEQAKKKAEADKVKAEHDAEEKRRASIVTYSVPEVAMQQIMEERNKPNVKEAVAILKKIAKNEAEHDRLAKRLNQLGQFPARVTKLTTNPN